MSITKSSLFTKEPFVNPKTNKKCYFESQMNSTYVFGDDGNKENVKITF